MSDTLESVALGDTWEYPDDDGCSNDDEGPANVTVSAMVDFVGAPPANVLTPRVPLEADMRAVCDAYVTNQLVLADGKSFTAHAIATAIGALRDGRKPSTGAVAAALARWEKVGYVTLKGKPVAFDDYTPAGRSEGLAALKAAFHANLMANRAAERTATKLTSGAQPPREPAEPFVPPAEPWAD